MPSTGEVLVRYLERRRDDEEEKVHRLLVDCLEVEAPALSTERDAELVDHQRAAMRNCDPAADSRRAEVLPPLEHLEEHPLGFFIEPEESDELLEDVVLRRAFELELDCVFRKKLAELHQVPLGCWFMASGVASYS